MLCARVFLGREQPGWGRVLSLQGERLVQLRRMSGQEIDAILSAIVEAETVPRLDYHVRRHGRQLDVQTNEEYVRALRRHLQRADLRIFTYLRSSDHAPFWELIAPDGTTAVYNENRSSIWSFFWPIGVNQRMSIAKGWWVEVLRAADDWHFEEHWQWIQ